MRPGRNQRRRGLGILQESANSSSSWRACSSTTEVSARIAHCWAQPGEHTHTHTHTHKHTHKPHTFGHGVDGKGRTDCGSFLQLALRLPHSATKGPHTAGLLSPLSARVPGRTRGLLVWCACCFFPNWIITFQQLRTEWPVAAGAESRRVHVREALGCGARARPTSLRAKSNVLGESSPLGLWTWGRSFPVNCTGPERHRRDPGRPNSHLSSWEGRKCKSCKQNASRSDRGAMAHHGASAGRNGGNARWHHVSTLCLHASFLWPVHISFGSRGNGAQATHHLPIRGFRVTSL